MNKTANLVKQNVNEKLNEKFAIEIILGFKRFIKMHFLQLHYKTYLILYTTDPSTSL